MRVAFLSPLPPARSGIADYSEALIESLKPLVDLEIFSSARAAFRRIANRYRRLSGRQQRASRFRLRNRAATSGRGGDARIEPASSDYRSHHPPQRLGSLHRRVRVQRRRRRRATLRCACEHSRSGPIMKASPMTRRLLESARGVIVHSRFMRDEMRAAGYRRPHRGDPARRMDSAGRPHGLSPSPGPG